MPDPLLNDDVEQIDWNERLTKIWQQARLLLRRYWWIVLVTTILGVAYQLREEWLKEAVYQSTAKMIITDRIKVPEGDAYQEQFANFFGTQIHLMKSGRVYQRAVDRVQALQPELEPVEVAVEAGQVPETTIFALYAKGSDPRYTRAFLDALLEEYKNVRKEMRTQTSQGTLLAISEQLYALEERISQEENAIVEFQKENNLVLIQEMGSTAGTTLAELKNQQAALKTQLRLLENLGLQAQQAADGMPGAVLDGAANVQVGNKLYAETKANLAQLRARHAEFGTYLKPKHPKMLALSAEIERSENLLRIIQRQAVDQLEEQKELLRRRIANLDMVIEEWQVTALENSRLAAEFERLNARLQRSRETYQRLLASLQSIDISSKVDQETVEVLENASPAMEIPSQAPQNVAKAGLAGMLAGLGILFGLSRIDTRIIGSNDLQGQFEHSVIAVIPKEKRNSSGDVELLHPKDSRHLFSEAWRTLRSSLLFMKNQSGVTPRTIMVSSSVPEEGKSTVAANLAVALAFTASRTLLLDADLRRGHLHEIVGSEAGMGLSSVLTGKSGLDETILGTSIEYLDILPVGEFPERPGDLIISEQFDETLRELRARYEYIVIDTAPVLAADDAAGMCTKADSVLFVVRSGQTLNRQVKVSLERLEMRGAHLGGFVLNFADTKGSDYHYYRKYSYERPAPTV